jgi:hypothetical protein
LGGFCDRPESIHDHHPAATGRRVITMDAPNGFITLYEAVDAVGRALFGVSWQYAIPPNLQADKDRDAHERVITVIAEGCEAGKIDAGYRKWNGASDNLDRSKWQLPHWRNYFATGTIDLELPLLDEKGNPVPDGRTALRCTREIFVRKDSLKQFMATLAPAADAHEKTLRPASKEEIRVEIRAVNNDAGKFGPNVRELAKEVKPRLNQRGLDASENSIIEIASDPEFKARRRPLGKTKASERRQ